MKCISLFAILLALIISTNSYASEVPEKLKSPFLQPQTALYIGSANYNVTLSKDSQSLDFQLNEKDITVYGFDIELNYYKSLNIGAYFRTESISKEVAPRVTNTRFSTLLGPFVKLSYAPQFLNRGIFYSQFFTRLEVSGGPVVMNLYPSYIGGFLGQGGIHVGFESYISKWIGLIVSYGRVFEFGRDTLFKSDLTTSGNAGIFLLGLKTTFF